MYNMKLSSKSLVQKNRNGLVCLLLLITSTQNLFSHGRFIKIMMQAKVCAGATCYHGSHVLQMVRQIFSEQHNSKLEKKKNQKQTGSGA